MGWISTHGQDDLRTRGRTVPLTRGGSTSGEPQRSAKKEMNKTEAKRLAEAHVPADVVVLDDHSEECEFGFFFPTDSRAHQKTGRFEDLLVGSCGVLVDRTSRSVHELGSAFSPKHWFEAYRRRLHLPCTVIVTKVFDRQRAAESLLRLQMTFVLPEEAHGTIWRIPQHYGIKHVLKLLDSLPARFENQNLILRLHEIQKIESGRDLILRLEPAEPSAAPLPPAPAGPAEDAH